MRKKKRQSLSSENKRLKRQIETLRFINKTIAINLEISESSQSVVDSIVNLFGYLGGTLFLVDEERGNIFSYTVSNTKLIKKVLESLDRPIDKYTTPINNPVNLIGRTVLEGKSHENSNLHEFVRGTVSEKVSGVIQRMTRMKLTMSFPLKYGDKVIGAWMFHLRRDSLTKEEKRLMELFSDQISIAIYNARLYSKVQHQVEQLDAKTKDLSSLLSVTEQAISSLDPDKVAQNIVNAVPKRLKHVNFIAGLIIDYDAETRTTRPRTITETELTKKALALLDKPLTDMSQKIPEGQAPQTLIGKSIEKQTIQMSDQLYEFISPFVPKVAAKAIQKMMGVQTIISVPMVVRNESVGAFVFFAGRNPHTISNRERDLSLAFANNMGLAIENARLYNIIEEKAKELESANEYLKKLDETKSNFLSIASHQLRTPISGILGYTSMLAQGDFGQLTQAQQQIINQNLVNIQRLSKLIDMFLNVSRIEADRLELDKEPVDIPVLLQEIVDLMTPQAEPKHLTLTLDMVQSEFPSIDLDMEKIRQVFMNLVDNAIKYTREGGVTIRAREEEETIVVEVQDTGIGLAPDQAKELFGKFVRAGEGAKLNANGSGLGLFIIKKIVEAHEGTVEVHSEGEGKGSLFVVTLPKKVSPSIKEPQKKAQKSA